MTEDTERLIQAIRSHRENFGTGGAIVTIRGTSDGDDLYASRVLALHVEAD